LDLSRFLPNDALADDTSLFDSGSLADDADQFGALVSHAEQLWHDSIRLLDAQSYATSIVLSIATMEELGKIAIARFVLPINVRRRRSGVSTQPPSRRNPLYSHRQKHQLASFGGFAVNNRADRVLGIRNIVMLFDLAQSGALETIRQSSLYSESVNGRIQMPLSIRSHDQCVFFCTAAGVLLAELGGFGPATFERLIADVEKFEQGYPLPNGYRLQISA
jgi:AbiV family abortive infection protein